MNIRCADCHTTFATMPNGPVAHGACPNCGGDRLEPDQPSPTKSDFDLYNMVDPGTGQDMGGNPLQEGILADNGWQPEYKRDESFASVKTADTTPAYHEVEVTPGPMGIHHRVLGLLHKLHSITVDGHPVSFDNGPNSDFLYGRYGHMGEENQRPVKVGAHHPAFANIAAKIIQSSKGDPREVGPDIQQLQQGLKSGQIQPPPKPGPMTEQYMTGSVPGFGAQAKVASDDFGFDLGDWDKSPQHIFIVNPSGKVVSGDAAHETHETLGAKHGWLKPNQESPLQGHSLGIIHDNGDVDFVQHETSHSPEALGQMLWGHFGQQFVVNPNLKPTTNQERWFKPLVEQDNIMPRDMSDQEVGIRMDQMRNRREQTQLEHQTMGPDRLREMQQAERGRGKPFGYYIVLDE